MRKRTSLAFYLPNLNGGGAERMSIMLALAFADRGFDVTFVLHKAEGELLHLLPPSIRVVSLNGGRSLAALPKLIGYLRREQPDILLSSLGHNNIMALWARRIARADTAVIVTQHSALSSESAAMGNWQHRVLPIMYRWFGGWADAILAVSKGVADDLAQTANLTRAKISVIYNPVVFPDFDARAMEVIPHRWLDDPAIPVFVGVGRLVFQKDFATLVRAFALVDPRCNARLLILGDGPLSEQLHALIESLGVGDRVELAGFVQNPLPYLRRATAVVMSSRYEGLGNVLIEAMACGTPVISTNCPHGPSEVLADGKFGELVPVGDAASLANAMTNVLGHRVPVDILRERSQDFSVDTIVAEYLALFKSVRSDILIEPDAVVRDE